MRFGEAVVVDGLGSAPTEPAESVVHDAPFGVRVLHRDAGSGAEHDLVEYPPGLRAQVHRHAAAHTIVVLDGRLAVNHDIIGPGGYSHFPAGEPMLHGPAGLGARVHRHTAAHTIVVLEGRLQANDRIVGPGAYCHFPAGEPMFHAPAGDDDCLFVIVFHGPYDVETLDR